MLLIVFDSLSEAACGALRRKLPALTALRGQAMWYPNAYAPSPESGPARASLFTGLDPAAHGVWTDGVALPERETTLAQQFATCGYRTWLVGRRHLAGVSHWTTEHARPREYTDLEWAHGPLHRSRQNAYLGWLQATAPAAYDDIFPRQPDPDATQIAGGQRAAMAALPDALSFNSWLGARVCDRIAEGRDDGPFFGVAGFVVGDAMGGAPRGAAHGDALDARALCQADAALARIVQRLEDTGQAAQTVLLVTSTRGVGANGAGANGASDPAEATRLMHESAINVPLMVRFPGVAPRAVDAVVSTIDVAPTLYALAQVPPPPRIQGRSLPRAPAGDAAVGWTLCRLRSPDAPWQTALRKGRWKLIVAHGRPDVGKAPDFALFDLDADPQETRDLAASPAHQGTLGGMIDFMIDARVAREDRTERRIAKF
ncbi:sulfatase family protein [Brevirhabdus sp.]|uniref:sulfatase family protein n=1 Tax=Brevirhabdus sp. TaxID=2004514 RepID=UPI00405971CC